MRQIRIGIVGCGYIAHYHARAILEQEGVEIRAACDLEEKAASDFARTYGISDVSNDVSCLVDRDDIDAAVLCTPNKFHAPHAIAFLQKHKDVFIEKPMAVNAHEAALIEAAACKAGRLVMVGHMWRFDTEVNYIRDIVRSGQIGRIIKTKSYGVHENWGPAGWFTQKDLAGGGALADMGVHAIDTIRYILGDPIAKQVYARIGTYYGDYEVDDTAVIVVSWEDQTISIIESGWWHPHADGPEAACQVFGTKGYAGVFPTRVKLAEGAYLREIIPAMPARKEHCDQVIYTRQMAHFVDCIRARKQPVPGPAQGRAVLRIVDAAYKSSETSAAISL